MSSHDIDKLNKQFSLTGNNNRLFFNKGEGDIAVVIIENEQASALISLQGAHLLSWVPQGEDDVIWLSKDASFLKAKSVRGGIPICWPWFGPHENAEFPAHGFARTVFWQVISTQQLTSGETQIRFGLMVMDQSESVQKMWPKNTSVQYILTIGSSLKLELITVNNGSEDVIIGEALHTYFNVDDVRHTNVIGLDGKSYIDKTDSFKRKQQIGDISVNEEVDRVYLQTADDVTINDAKRKIVISTQGSQSTVVWNPWKQVAEKMGDLGEDGYLKMLCVESANAAEDVVVIKPDATHVMQVTYSLEKSSA